MLPHPPSPLDRHLGIQVTALDAERVEAVVDVDPEKHHQPYGVVHGGLYCTIVETLASLGAWVAAERHGLKPVGIENHTSFLRRLERGRIHAYAEPVRRGRRLHLWQVTCRDEEGRILAQGSCRVLLLPRDEDAGA